MGSPQIERQPAILRYPGSKWTLALSIVERFPDHFHYVEPYLGSGAVFFTKPPSPHEVLNDLNGDIVNLFTIMRDHTDELCWLLETTPWARAEYDASDDTTDEPMEAARRFVVRCWQAHASDLAKKTGWKHRGATQRAAGMSHRWQKLPEQLRAVAGRLRDAEIEQRDALDVIRRHSSPDTLIFADPPYGFDTLRTQKMYRHELDHAQHIELLETLLAHRGSVVLCGYANELYDQTLADWDRVETSAPKTEKAAARTEVLWMKTS